ncbi:MAG: hypothetical protein WBQ25_24265 [Nitrososphaeraceae archaeon]
MSKKAMRKSKQLDLDDIKKQGQEFMKEIIIERNKIRAELGEPLIEA